MKKSKPALLLYYYSLFQSFLVQRENLLAFKNTFYEISDIKYSGEPITSFDKTIVFCPVLLSSFLKKYSISFLGASVGTRIKNPLKVRFSWFLSYIQATNTRSSLESALDFIFETDEVNSQVLYIDEEDAPTDPRDSISSTVYQALEIFFFSKKKPPLTFVSNFLVFEFKVFQFELLVKSFLFENRFRFFELQELIDDFYHLYDLINLAKNRKDLAIKAKEEEEQKAKLLEEAKREAVLRKIAQKAELERRKRLLNSRYRSKKRISARARFQQQYWKKKQQKQRQKLKPELQNPEVVSQKKEWIVQQFFSKLVKVNTKNGHKKRSLKLLLDSLASARHQLKLRLSNKEILKKIYTKVNPFFVLRKHSFGRRTSLIPLPLREEKAAGATARLFFGAVRRRGEASLKEKLIEEIKDFFLQNKKPASVVARNVRIQTALENKGNIRFLGKKNKRRRR